MSNPRIHGRNRPLTASDIRETVGDALAAIRLEDRRTWVDMGEVIGKSEDQVAKYADGTAEMGLVSYTKGRIAWGSRLTGSLDRLIERQRSLNPMVAQSRVLKAALCIAEASEDGEITDDEIREHRAEIETARDALDALLTRLRLRSAA